jgi:hypothetical protein
MDWETLKSCLTDDVHYEDVPTEDPGARDPENVVRRLRIAFDHLSDHKHVLHHMACEGDVVFLDHTEEWTFKSGEKVSHQFCTAAPPTFPSSGAEEPGGARAGNLANSLGCGCAAFRRAHS